MSSSKSLYKSADQMEEWNILEKSAIDDDQSMATNTKKGTNSPDLEKGNRFSVFGGISGQIVETLNNKLFEISGKMDMMLERMEELEKKIEAIQNYNKGRSEATLLGLNNDNDNDNNDNDDYSNFSYGNNGQSSNYYNNQPLNSGLKYLITEPTLSLPIPHNFNSFNHI